MPSNTREVLDALLDAIKANAEKSAAITGPSQAQAHAQAALELSQAIRALDIKVEQPL
jgi:hypothetical protein